MADDLDDAEAEALAGLAEDGMPEPEAPGDALFDTSHDGLALDMGRLWTDARHVAPWGRWYFYDGVRWAADESLLHMTRTRAYLRDKGDELVRWAQAEGDDKKLAACEVIAKALRSAPMVAHVVGLARSNPDQVATVAQWDRDPYLLGTPAGTVDLRTGELRDPSPDDYITKLTAVAPAAAGTPCPLWTRTLARIFRHDGSIIPFLQRALGYALTGECKEHVLFFAWGQGGNGKGVVLNAASGLLGDYAAVAPQDMLLVTQSDRHPCDMAMLRGARFVTAQELAPGRAWDEPKMKSLTGGDPVTARFMRQDFFTFQPQFTLFVAGNHKPAFKGVDQAIRRRVLLLPFLQNITAEERDPALPKKLEAEWPAILRWMIDGCLAWQREGLNPPASVRAATDDYLNAEDVLGQWLDERCIVSPRIDWTSLTSLYGCWKLWCDDRGQHPGTSTALSKKLDERGFRRWKRPAGVGFLGIGLAEAPRDDGNDASAHIDRIRAGAGARAHTRIHRICGRPSFPSSGRRRRRGDRPLSAVSLLAEAAAAGVTLRLVAGNPKVGGNPSPDLLARLRQHKPELIELLSGNACRYCGERIDWREPGARPFADDTAAHNGCWEDAEIDRLLRSGHRAVNPRLAEDAPRAAPPDIAHSPNGPPMTRTADRTPRGYAFTGAEHDAALAEPWSIGPSEIAELLRPLGWVGDIGATTAFVHRKTLTRLSVDLDFWPSALRAVAQAALVIARADADARRKATERPAAGNPGPS